MRHEAAFVGVRPCVLEDFDCGSMLSCISMSMPGRLSSGYQSYYSDDGDLVGEATVGCNPNSSWGSRTDNAVFHAGCGVSS